MLKIPRFTHSNLKSLLISQVPADFSDWLDFVAIGALLAFVWQVPTVVFAFLAVAMGLPYLLVGPLAGAIVDRLPIRSVLLGSNLGRAMFTACFAFAQSWELLLLFIVLRNSVDAFFTPAKQAAIQSLTEIDERNAANGISISINQLSKVIAPAIGGAFLAVMSPQSVFILNAFVSLSAALLIFRMRPIKRPKGDEENDSMSIFGQIKSALALINRSSILKLTIGLMAMSFFGMFFYDTLIAPMAAQLGYTQTDLGLSLTFIGAGGVAGALIITALGSKASPLLMIGLGTLISSSIVVYFGAMELFDLSANRMTIGLFLFIVGVCGGLSMVPFRTLMQTHTPPNQIGQITALSEAANTLALLTAPFAGAAIASLFSLGVAFIIGGVVTLSVATMALSNWKSS